MKETGPDEEEYEEISLEEDEELSKAGTPADVAPTPKDATMSVFTIRIDTDTLEALYNIAEQEGTGPSVVARRLLQKGIEEQGAETLPEKEIIRAAEEAKAAAEKLLKQRKIS